MPRLATTTAFALSTCLASLVAAQDSTPPQQPEQPKAVVPTRPMHAVEKIRREASRLRRVVERDGTRMMLFAASWLPVVSTRTVMYNEQTRDALTVDQFNQLTKEQAEGYAELKLDDNFYYFTRYGSPTAYSRPVDLLAALEPGVKNYFRGKRVLDFGFGTIGHLRLIALLGGDVVGVEVDPVLKALYSDPGDVGEVKAAISMGADVSDGHLKLVFGNWPGEVREQTGADFDVIISKNVLKRGYIHPDQPVDERMLVKLGVSDEDFVKALFDSLKPGGVALIYNIHPKQKDDPKDYIPWADGRSPFARDLLERSGFEVVEFDKDDSEGIRLIGRTLKWDEGETPMDINNDLFATYTLLRKPSK
jgi:SAM-dependent methyltransferase